MIAADSDAEAERIASSADLHYARRAKGEYLPLASPEEAAVYPYAPIDRERIARHRARLIVGGIDRVKERLRALIDATRADEVMITTMVYDHASAPPFLRAPGASLWANAVVHRRRWRKGVAGR